MSQIEEFIAEIVFKALELGGKIEDPKLSYLCPYCAASPFNINTMTLKESRKK